jgi:hypothetical protein
MTLPGFNAENSIGRTVSYHLAPTAGEVEGIQPQLDIPEGAALELARCLPQFREVWSVCNVIDGVPIYCQEFQFLGFACS